MTPKRGEVALEVVPGPAATPVPYGALPPDPMPDTLSLREYLDMLAEGRWLIAAVVALALVGGVSYALLATPIYRTDAIVQVEDAKATKGLLGDLSAAFGDSSPAETEIEILHSRALVGGVVKELELDVVALPKRFPVLGKAIARGYRGDAVARAPLGLSSFGWGGERVSIGRLDVPRALLGKKLTLVAREEAKYVLLDDDGVPLLEGDVRKPAAGRGVELFVSELRARPGLEFSVVKRDRDGTVADLQEEIRISEKGKKTGILRLVLDGEDPARIAAILDSLARGYVRQNVERRSAEAGKTLEFLETQLPVLHARLEATEAELERYRSRKGSVTDITLETQAAVARAVEIEKAASELNVQHAELRLRFTEDHPVLAAIAKKLKSLDAERDALDARLKKLPEAELEFARRTRDVKVANELYLMVLNKAQELKVMKEGTIGNVRVLDAAIVPVKPISPKKLLAVLMSLLGGLVLGVAAVFTRRALEEGVEDPEALERALGIGVHASVPHSSVQEETEARARRERATFPLLAVEDPKDLAVESLRSLRTSLLFALAEARNTVVAIGGPAPGVGKSFVTANLAHLLGEAGKRVLVVDADLRRGRLHQHYGMERASGLAEAITGDLTPDEAIRATRSPNVSVVTTGVLPPNPAELLGSERFQRLLADLAGRHDVVLVDTPPVLAVTDAALVARHAGVNLLVVRAGRQPMREIAAALRQLGRNGVRVHGIVMNDVRLERGLGRRNAYHYQYKYE